MSLLFTKKSKRFYLFLTVVFILFFLFRLGYGYTLDIQDNVEPSVSFDSFSSDNKKNYASNEYKGEKFEIMQESSVGQVDQKYEQIAEVKSSSNTFQKDEDFVRDQIDGNFGIIQYERKTGNEGKRKLQLQVGVPPENFDTLYGILIKIGDVKSKEIIKNDKTNDYLELNAKKASLEKTLASLVEFKEKNGKIDEYINLENRILEIEERLQQLGVNLGDFDESNEFCTIQFSLAEVAKVISTEISFYHRVKVALEWTLKMYLRFIAILFFVVGGVFCFVYILSKRKK